MALSVLLHQYCCIATCRLLLIIINHNGFVSQWFDIKRSCNWLLNWLVWWVGVAGSLIGTETSSECLRWCEVESQVKWEHCPVCAVKGRVRGWLSAYVPCPSQLVWLWSSGELVSLAVRAGEVTETNGQGGEAAWIEKAAWVGEKMEQVDKEKERQLEVEKQLELEKI